MRIPRPLSPQLISDEIGCTPLPLMVIEPSALLETIAPSFRMTSNAAKSSLLLPTLYNTDVPQCNNAAAHARCILLLLGGALKLPCIDEGVIVTIIIVTILVSMYVIAQVAKVG